MTSAVRSNSLVPSASTVGASSCAPMPFVLAPLSSCATYASTGAFCAASSLSLSDADVCEALLAPPRPTCSITCMPAASCPEIWQYAVYIPALTSERSSRALSPGAISGVLSSVPLIARLCVVVPAFFTVSVAPALTVMGSGSILNSDSVTGVSVAAAATLFASLLRLNACPATTTAPNASNSASSANTQAPIPIASSRRRATRVSSASSNPM